MCFYLLLVTIENAILISKFPLISSLPLEVSSHIYLIIVEEELLPLNSPICFQCLPNSL